MENDFFKNNPVFKSMEPEKLAFLMNFANSKKPTEMKDMVPFLLGAISSAQKQDIHFTQPETAEKADKIIRLIKERNGLSH